MACFERFDEALLSLFTYAELARPFRIVQQGDHDWRVYKDNKRWLIQESGEMYETSVLPELWRDGPGDWR